MPMVVSMIQFRIELAGIESLKDKRRIVSSLKEKLRIKFHLSVAEVGMQDSLGFAHLGAALVSNSRQHGETVLHKALAFIEHAAPGRLMETEIYSEMY